MSFFSKLKHRVVDYQNKQNQFRLEIPSSDFIPYACHIDPKSIITKNGDILQVIKVSGLTDLTDKDNSEIRELIRKSLIKNINSTDIAIWVHTIRTRRNIDTSQPFANKVSHYIHKQWVEKNYWNDKFINEIYITIVIRGQEFKLNTFSNILNSLTFDSLTRIHNNYITKIHQSLKQVVDSIVDDLKDCGAEVLKIVNTENGTRSQPVEFFSKIINLRQEELTVPIVDLSKYLINQKSAFGNNSFEIMSNKGKYFGAMFSIKEYHETATKYLNNLLLLPEQMVITQTMGFINKNKAEEQFKYQNYIFDVSLDADFRRMMGLDRIMAGGKGTNTDFGDSQITVMISAPTQDKLNQQIKRFTAALSENGFMFYREDLAMEDLFWSQLPANFSFVRRKSPLPFSLLGGFLSLNNYPAGRTNSLWGSPVTIFRTNQGTPYFFNFHNKEGKGNTVIIGPKGTYKSAIARFLASESSHLNTKCIYFSSKSEDGFANTMMAKNFNSEEFISTEISDLARMNLLSINESFVNDLRSVINKSSKNLDSKVIVIIDCINAAITKDSNSLNVIKDFISIDNPNLISLVVYNSEEDRQINKELFDSFATKIFLPDKDIATRAHLKPLLSAYDINTIKGMNLLYKHFLIKQDNDNLILEFNITGLEDVINILSGNEKDIKNKELYK
ncbi:MAG: hypothetical protein J0G32_01890 [Alphaproteobacteria bacterium]|nr:hypothetical protein [Alphaproteobacteria bacterium]OJV15364.1 MAG: hypothetical protein BGO27_02530 [Alphaproteobacteria bacterium 33-17]